MGQKNNLVKNASFLMIAAMISKVIGLLYKSPLSSIVGNMGMGYISLAQNAYMILLMIASFSIPQAVSKLISERSWHHITVCLKISSVYTQDSRKENRW